MRECYLCGGAEFNKRPGSVRDDSDLSVCECISCGLIFLSSFDHIDDQFYRNSQMLEDGTSELMGKDLKDATNRFREAELDSERRVLFLQQQLLNHSVLDFGCGEGGFLAKAQKLASVAHGVELELRLQNSFKQLELTVYENLSQLQRSNPDAQYDIITLFHILEHLPDPKKMVMELLEFLSDKGQIVIEVPNADDALFTLYSNEPFSNFTYWSCHLFLYTAKTLQMLFDQMDLKVNYIKQIQRYPLSNHLYWLANGRPGGHQKWHFLDSPDLHTAYEKQLAAIGKCDTILASVSRLKS